MKNKFSIAMSLAVVLAMLLTSLALADDVTNNIDPTVDSVAEVMSLTVGGTNGFTDLYTINRNGDGKNGCNLTGGTTLILDVINSNPGVATVSPTQLTFTNCENEGSQPSTGLTVTPVSTGSTSISLSLVSNNSGGSFNLVPAAFTVNVAPPPNTPPTVVVAGVTGGASYNKGSVPAATCQVTDAEDGNSSFAATLSAVTGPYASDGIGEQTASCSYTDGGGLTASGSETYGIVDPSAPSITYTLAPASPDGSNGWYKSSVTLTWTVSESESPNSLAKTGCVDQNITADQVATSYSCAATSAGGSAGPVTVTIQRDATAPTIVEVRSPAANANGWNNEDVNVGFSCSDGTSFLADCGPYYTLSNEGANQSVVGTATDNAGNSTSLTVSNINIDKTAPIASASVSPVPNANGWNNTNVTVTFSGSDGLSGIATCSANAVLSSEGIDQSASGTCTDLADNISVPATASGINIDKTAPVVNVTGVSNGATYTLGSVPAASCSTTDALSGVATNASLAVSGGPVGLVTASCGGALDNAGNPGSASVTYSVVYNWSGFFQPIDNNGVYNVAKAGSTIPVKFSLGGDQGLGILMAGSPSSVQVTCPLSAATDAVEELTTATSGLRYDPLANQYIYNWKTLSGYAGTCRKLTVKLIDGSEHTALFKFTR